MDAYTQLARQSISTYLQSRTLLAPPPDLSPPLLEHQSGVFVSLHRRETEELRGCIGTILPTKHTIAEEIIANAVSAAFRDPRFVPLTADELQHIEIKVDVLSPLRPVSSIDSLNPDTHGLLVKHQNKTGVLLPGIGIPSAAEQFSLCCQKAGIDPGQSDPALYAFTVERHRE